MNRYIGIARERGEFGRWYTLNFIFMCRMIKITLYTKRTKFPKIYVYNKEQFDYSVNQQEIVQFKWFLGVVFNY